VILVTSVPAWRFSTLTPLPRTEQQRLRAEHRFGEAPFALLDVRPAIRRTTAAPDDDRPARRPSAHYMAASADLGAAGWTVFTLTPTGSILSGAVAGARAVALLVGLAICGLAGAVLRWRGQASLRAARQEAARAELEARVEERTAELRKSNRRLTVEMEERRRAEAHVHLMRDELVQSNKLATLGQIAAGVAHEINQPVAAIRAYADNASIFLDRADPATARNNLGLISGLTDRIGLITDELRAFARKTSAPPLRSPCAKRSTAPCCWSGLACARPASVSSVTRPTRRPWSWPSGSGWSRCWSTCCRTPWRPWKARPIRRSPSRSRLALADPDRHRRQRPGLGAAGGQDAVHAVRHHQAPGAGPGPGHQPRHRRRVRRRAFPGSGPDRGAIRHFPVQGALDADLRQPGRLHRRRRRPARRQCPDPATGRPGGAGIRLGREPPWPPCPKASRAW
jgi:hypothetical protein